MKTVMWDQESRIEFFLKPDYNPITTYYNNPTIASPLSDHRVVYICIWVLLPSPISANMFELSEGFEIAIDFQHVCALF